MPSVRVQRHVDGLLDEAEEAMRRLDWKTVRDRAEAVLSLDQTNPDAVVYRTAAERHLESTEDNHPVPSRAGSTVPSTPIATSVPDPTSVGQNRYQVKQSLGEGATKRVYLAHDTQLDRDVALAFIKIEHLDAAGQERMVREPQTLGRLGEHPNVVTIYDVGEEEGQPYMVSQFMAGGDLETLLDKAPDRKLPLDQTLRIAQDVCKGLSFAHGKGVFHRDIKPANIWLTPDGNAKIGDFGLAKAQDDRTRLTQQLTMVGTLSYMPPEQALGGSITAQSDLYSLGVVLYELVTGRPPFLGDDAAAVIGQHLNTPPVAPTWHRPDCPAGLEVLILRLLEKDATKRPASAKEVERTLAAIAAHKPTKTADEPLPTANPVYQTVFVGRQTERQQLHDAFDAAILGQGTLVMVTGEPGLGKSTLCAQLAAYATLRGGSALVGHCYEGGSLRIPYLPFVEALRSYVLKRPLEGLREDLGPGASEVARIVTEIRERVQVELRPPGDPEDDRWRLYHGVTDFLAHASQRQPLLIVLEDLQAADQGTLDLLVHLSYNLAHTRLLVVGTYRGSDVDRAHPLSAALAELRRNGDLTRISLHGLTIEEVRRMITLIRGQEVPRTMAETIFRQTEGNPLFIQETLRYLMERAASVGMNDSITDSTIPEGLRDVIGKRLSRLSEPTNQVLSIASVVGRDFRLDVLKKVINLPEEEVDAALEEASDQAVIEELPGVGTLGFRFTHAFFRQTLYDELFASRRLRVHQQVARALEELYGRRAEDHAAELAEHFAQSTDNADLQQALHYAEVAARRAMGVYAYGEAVNHLKHALKVLEVLDTDDLARRGDLLLSLAGAQQALGDYRQVIEETGLEAFGVAQALGDSNRAWQACHEALQSLLSEGLGTAYGTPSWREWTERAAKFAQPGTAEQAYTDAQIGRGEWALGKYDAAWEIALSDLELARQVNDQHMLFTIAGGMVGWVALPRFERERLRLAEEVAPLLIDPEDRTSAAIVGEHASYVAAALLSWGQRERAEELWRLTSTASVTTRASSTVLLARVHEIVQSTMEGRLEDALALGERLITLGDEVGRPQVGRRYAERICISARIYLGQGEAILLGLPDVPEDARIADIGRVAGPKALALSHLGRLDEARTVVEVVLARLESGLSADDIPTLNLSQLLEAAVLAGEKKAAAVFALPLQGLAEICAFGAAAAGTCVARHLGAAAALLGELDKARAYDEQAIAVCNTIAFRPELALSRVQFGELLLEHFPQDRTEALKQLDMAIDEFRQMKMQSAFEQALRDKLVAIGANAKQTTSSVDVVAVAVRDQRPDLRSKSAPDGTVTILFSDIQDFTAMTERLGDQQAQQILRDHNIIVRRQLAVHGGFEVKAEGDGFMLAFSSAHRAIQCAVAMQRSLAEYNADHAGAVQVRIGLHTGDVISEADDFFGKHVILASRIADMSRGGEIWVSSLLKDLVSTAGDIKFGDQREVEFKGLSGTYKTFSIRWE